MKTPERSTLRKFINFNFMKNAYKTLETTYKNIMINSKNINYILTFIISWYNLKLM